MLSFFNGPHTKKWTIKTSLGYTTHCEARLNDNSKCSAQEKKYYEYMCEPETDNKVIETKNKLHVKWKAH